MRVPLMLFSMRRIKTASHLEGIGRIIQKIFPGLKYSLFEAGYDVPAGRYEVKAKYLYATDANIGPGAADTVSTPVFVQPDEQDTTYIIITP